MRRNTKPTQNHATISRRTFCSMVSCGSFFLLAFASGDFLLCAFLSFTFHHHRSAFCWLREICSFTYFQLDQIRRVIAGITRRAEITFAVIHGLAQSSKRNVSEGVGTKEGANIFGRVRRSNQLFARGGVHAVVARRNGRRAGNPNVKFPGPSFTYHADDLSTGCAAHDRIVHEHDALTFHESANGIEFELHAEIPDRLRRLDEGTADGVIANQTHAERNAGFHRVTDGSGHAGVRNGHDNVCLHRMLTRKQAAEFFAAFVYAAAKDDTVGSREIDMLENAELVRLLRREAN